MFVNKREFSKDVIEAVKYKKLSFMDAVIHLCEKRDIDIEDSYKFISKEIREKIEAEAKQLRFLPRNAELDNLE